MATTLVEQPKKTREKAVKFVEPVTIHETTRYDQFIYDPRNRPINWGHVQTLFDSICENNLLADYPIIVESRDGQLIVLDGQHRLEAAKILECPIYYVISERMTFDDVHRVNDAQKGWDNFNYLNRWIREDRPEYIRFKTFTERFSELGFNFSMTLCMYGSNKLVRQAFKSGRYVCDNIELAEKIGEAARSLEPFAKDFCTHSYFLVALRALLSNPRYDHEQMLNKLEYQGLKMRKQADSRSYIEMLLSIYNFKARGSLLTVDGVITKNQREVIPHG